jgi:DNA polymerase III sliding clamp (beta) subunit (PCNA family)
MTHVAVALPTTVTASVPAAALANAVKRANLAAVKRRSLPILACVRIGEGKVCATNLEQDIIVTVEALAGFPPVCVPAMPLLQLLKSFKGDVCLVPGEGHALRVGEATLTGYDPQEYPALQMDTQAPALIGTCVLPPRWAAVLPAVSPDASRGAVAGLGLDIARGAVAATDGHRLHLVEWDLSGQDTEALLEHQRRYRWSPPVMPAEAAKMAAKLGARGPVVVSLYTASRAGSPDEPQARAAGQEEHSPRLFRVAAGGTELWTRAHDTGFPDYTQVTWVPDGATAVSVPRAALIEALQACRPFLEPPRRMGVTVQVTEDGLSVTATHPEHGAVTRMLPASGGTRALFGLNARYLTEALMQMEAETALAQIPRAGQDGTVSRAIHLFDREFHATIATMRIL